MRQPLILLLAAWMTASSMYASPRPGGPPRHTRRHVEYGVASWYKRAPRPHLTASGDVYDDNQLTAAHRTLPFGSKVRVTNLRNGQSVVVKINDRGPNIPGRLIDLSKAAAARVGLRHRGVARVRVAVISRPLREPGS